MSSESAKSGPLGALTTIDRIVHEPARLLILAYLYVVESADFLFLMRQTNLTKGNLSAHLSKLENAGYVNIEKTFKGKLPLTVCKLTEAGQKAFEGYRQQMQSFIEKTQ